MASYRSTVMIVLPLACGAPAESSSALDAGTPTRDVMGPIDPGPDGPISGLFDGLRLNFNDQDGSVYYSTQNKTTIGGQHRTDATDDAKVVQVSTVGKSQGVYHCGDDGGTVTGIVFSESQASYSTIAAADLTPCTISITHYGLVGEHVTGTFDGVLLLSSGSTTSPPRVTVTNGTFDVLRTLDQ